MFKLIANIWSGLVSMVTGPGLCHKEQLGYRCKHTVFADGSRECD